MSGVNGNVIMSGYGDENPDDEGREAVRGYTNSLSGELTVVEAAMMIGVSSRQVMAACSPLAKGTIERLSQPF